MLPSYTPPNLPVIRHIHLGVWSDSPSGMGDNGEPPYLFKSVRDRLPVPELILNFRQAWDGTPYPNTLEDADGNPLVFNTFEYLLKVDLNGYDLLKHLVGRQVMLVDNLHCSDVEDHTPFIKRYFFMGLEYQGFEDQLLTFNNVKCTFKDLSTISPV